MLLADQRIAEVVVLVVELDDRAGQGGALLDAEPLGHRPRRHVAHHYLEGDDLDLVDELLAHVQPAHEMGRHADLVQPQHDVFGDAVVEHALAADHALLLGVEGAGVVLEILDDRARFRPSYRTLALPS